MNARPLAVCLLLLAACDSSRQQRTAPPDSTPAPPAAAMNTEMAPGMAGMMDTGMMQRMTEQMRAMQGAGGDSLRAMLPMHRQLTANMLAEMNGEMRKMGMAAAPEWEAVVDSLRRDLTRMPEMSPAELQAFMSAHLGRVAQLMRMHRSMMQGMKL